MYLKRKAVTKINKIENVHGNFFGIKKTRKFVKTFNRHFCLINLSQICNFENIQTVFSLFLSS